MASVYLDIPPSYYTEEQTANWVLEDNVVGMTFTTDGAQPTLSEYIAYDTLTPPNPFIAVTQDGRGNVVYDGGFPKFYNSNAPAAGALFSQLSGSFKYLYNAINFVANKDKVNAGNKSILVLGDSPSNYRVKGTGASDFHTSFTRIAGITGFSITVKDYADYPNGLLNSPISELEQYALIIIMSSDYTTTPRCTDDFVQNIVSFRENGGGLIFITDHGSHVINTIEEVATKSEGFYALANKIIVNFGCWFSGDYNRVPVNVGFIRQNYGDHPLYNNMSDSENITAGGSESQVTVTEFPIYTREDLPVVNLGLSGGLTVRALAILDDGSTEMVRLTYVVGGSDIIDLKTSDGILIDTQYEFFDNYLDFDVQFNTEGLGDVAGRIFKNETQIGEFKYDSTFGKEIIWYAAAPRFIPVKKGDFYKIVMDTPFLYEKVIEVNRETAEICKNVSMAETVKRSKTKTFEGENPNNVLKRSVFEISNRLSHLNLEVKSIHTKNIEVVKGWHCDTLELSEVLTNVYPTQQSTEQGLIDNSPPTMVEIFNSWSRFDGPNYFNVGETMSGNAAAWVYDSTVDSVRQPLNSGVWNGVVSLEELDTYEHTVKVSSSNADDDHIGILLAFRRVDNINHVLIFFASQHGINSHEVTYYRFQSGQPTVVVPIVANNIAGTGGPNNGNGAWSGKHTTLNVVRKNDKITTLNSLWNTTTLDSRTKMEFSLDDFTELEVFKGPSSYGYVSFSQADSIYRDIIFKGNSLRNLIINAATGDIYIFSGGEWIPTPKLNLAKIFKAPRKIRSLVTNELFLLSEDGSLTII